jgi:hypothetical protein
MGDSGFCGRGSLGSVTLATLWSRLILCICRIEYIGTTIFSTTLPTQHIIEIECILIPSHILGSNLAGAVPTSREGVVPALVQLLRRYLSRVKYPPGYITEIKRCVREDQPLRRPLAGRFVR